MSNCTDNKNHNHSLVLKASFLSLSAKILHAELTQRLDYHICPKSAHSSRRARLSGGELFETISDPNSFELWRCPKSKVRSKVCRITTVSGKGGCILKMGKLSQCLPMLWLDLAIVTIPRYHGLYVHKNKRERKEIWKTLLQRSVFPRILLLTIWIQCYQDITTEQPLKFNGSIPSNRHETADLVMILQYCWKSVCVCNFIDLFIYFGREAI